MVELASKSGSRPSLWQWASRALFGLAILLLIGHLVVYVYYAIELMRFPFDYDQGEGFELVDTILFSKGEWPYRSNEVYPFYASNYPPLFHVMLVPFVWVFGEAYWYGRLAGFLGTLVTASAIGYMVYRDGRQRVIAVMSGLAFLASNYIYHIGPLFRQHMMMVMFETLSVAVLAHAADIENPRRRRQTMIVGLVLLLAAGYTKQLALATCVAVFGFLFLRNPRRSILWGMVFAAVAGGVFLWINVATHGEWYANIIAANVNQYLPQQFVGLFRQWFRLHGILIVMAGLTAAYELYFARLSLYSIWWVLAVADSALSGKWGAGDSYFATATAATCVLAGLFAARTLRGGWSFPDNYLTRPFRSLRAPAAAHRAQMLTVTGIVIPALYLLYGVSVIKLPTQGAVFGPLSSALGLTSSYGTRYAFYDSAGWTEGYATIGHIPTQTDVDNGWRIVDILRASDRAVMSEEAGFSLRAGKDVVTNPTQLKNLYENGLFDPTNLVNAIRENDFGVIVFRAQFYPPPVLDAVYEAYYPAETIPMNGFDYEIWRPGPAQAERAAFAGSLETLAPGEEFKQTWTLPFDNARAWLHHALTYYNWEPSGKAFPPEEGRPCLLWPYAQPPRGVSITLCAAGARTEVTIRRGH
jgi:hypothetical protein